MPKYCSAPRCRKDSGKSFYKFPLQDPVRLQQWLKNMGRDSWTPSRHQYICHQHFEPSCFKVRWGVRYLESDAVPTVFQEPEDQKDADPSERTPKRLRGNGNASVTASGDGAATRHAAAEAHTLHLYEVAMDPSQRGQAGSAEWSDARDADGSVRTDGKSLAALGGGGAGLNFPLTLYQTVGAPGGGGEDADVLVVSAEDGRDELDSGITAAVLRQGGGVLVSDSILGCAGEAVLFNSAQGATHPAHELLELHEGGETEVIAYFETIPNVFPSEASSQFTSSPDTVLSSALSSEPISSTLPITSKHTAPPAPPLVVTLQSVDPEEAEPDEGMSELDDAEQPDHMLEEHCYHKNSLSKEQLEAMVAELQKKVKVLQQRHRRHLEKLLGLENTVSQLRQSNLLNEERLQLLERAYVQTGAAAASDAGGTVAIIYEEDSAAYLYTPLSDAETTP